MEVLTNYEYALSDAPLQQTRSTNEMVWAEWFEPQVRAPLAFAGKLGYNETVSFLLI